MVLCASPLPCPVMVASSAVPLATRQDERRLISPSPLKVGGAIEDGWGKADPAVVECSYTKSYSAAVLGFGTIEVPQSHTYPRQLFLNDLCLS